MKLFLGSLFLIAVMIITVGISAMGIYLLLSSSFQKYAPPVRSSGRLKNAILAEISKYLEKAPSGQKIVDLGSGWGTLLIPLSKKFPQHEFVGIERAMTPYFISRFRARKTENLTFLKDDFFAYDLGDTNVVIMFLIGFMMPKVTKKCFEELPKGAKIYVSRFSLTGVEAETVVSLGSKMETYYIYNV